MIDLSQNTEPKPWHARLLDACHGYLQKLTGLEMAVLALSGILVLVMFTGGVGTMIQEVAGSFPIPKPMRYPVGAALMIILAWSAKLLTKELAEMLHDFGRYSLSYKIMLPIATLATLIFCWAVQSESVSIVSQKEFEEKLNELSVDSAQLRQIDMAIATTLKQISSDSATLGQYEKIKTSRRGHWLSEDEQSIIQNAQISKKEGNAQLLQLIDKRTAEQQLLMQKISEAEQELESLQSEAQKKGRGKAGLVEGLMFFLMFFVVSYKRRFKPQEAEVQNLVQEFPTGLSIEEREALIKEVKPLSYDEDNHHLLVEMNGERYFHEVPKLVKQASNYRRRLDKAQSEASRDTQLRNIAYVEQLLAMAPIQPEGYKRVFGYTPLFLDYWNNTSGTGSHQLSESVQNRSKTALHRSEPQDIDLFP